MSILTDGVTPVTLPDDLQWVDEFDWLPVSVKTGRTITGALWVQESAIAGGRPITLQGGDSFAWVSRSVVAALWALAGQVNVPLTLTLRGTNYSVAFERENGKAIEARPIQGFADVDAADKYSLTLRLRTV